MPEYPKVRIWQDALAIHPEDDDEIFRARERLRHAYEQFRERAQILANEIRRDLPDLTVHDITHSDALWEMADIIAGPNISLTPTEAFVLGGAFLIHDLGLGVAAYPEGVKSLKDQLIWQDTYL